MKAAAFLLNCSQGDVISMIAWNFRLQDAHDRGYVGLIKCNDMALRNQH